MRKARLFHTGRFWLHRLSPLAKAASEPLAKLFSAHIVNAVTREPSVER